MNRFFKAAVKEAEKSDYKHRHGAVMVRGGSIVNSSPNKARPVNFAHKHHHSGCGSLHAEIGCVLNITKDKTKGLDIYVVRINRDGDMMLSKPCDMCRMICGEMGISRIFYSIDNNKTGMVKL